MLTSDTIQNVEFLMRCESEYGNPYLDQSPVLTRIHSIRQHINFQTLIWHPELIVSMHNPREGLEAWLLDTEGMKTDRIDDCFRVIAAKNSYYHPEHRLAKWYVRPLDKSLIGKQVLISCPAVIDYIPSGDYLLTPETRAKLNPHYQK